MPLNKVLAGNLFEFKSKSTYVCLAELVFDCIPNSDSVKCRFSKCRFSVLNLKFDFISDGGCAREKQIQKALGSLPPCGNRCRFCEGAICSSRVHPPSEIKSNFKFKTLRWRPLRWRLTLSAAVVLNCCSVSQGTSPREIDVWLCPDWHWELSSENQCACLFDVGVL